jgi:Na+/H+ antiporter NhaD/arsenite permease-like protein
MSILQTLATIIIITTLIGVAIGRYPKLRMNRATISLVGATLLAAIGAISINEAFDAVDLNTIVLLFSMMIINVNLRLSGFFGIISNKIISLSKTPSKLLGLITFCSGFLSAVFLNDTIVLMFTPLLLEITKRQKINPIPFLIILVASANIGSAATFIGNPQNMIIGTSSGIAFSQFTIYQLPVVIAGLFLIWLIIRIIYRREFRNVKIALTEEIKIRPYKPLLIKSIVASLIMITAFFIGVSIPLAALIGAAILLITRRLKPERVFREIDWSLLVFFASLFVVTHSIKTSGLSELIFINAKDSISESWFYFSVVSTVLSNIVSNVPAVLLMKQIIPQLPDPETAWMVLAMVTTFAGNLTLLGSVANLIVAESAKSNGVHLSFLEYLKAGIPITLFTIAVGVLWFSII